MVYNKNDSSYYTERIKYDASLAKELIGKAQDILFSEDPNDFPRIGTNKPSWYECRFCGYSDVCFGKVTPDKNCRSCSNCDLIGDGKFSCNKNNDKVLSLDEQAKGCEKYNMLEGFKNART